MLILGIDCESTGLSITEARIVQLGASLYDTQRARHISSFETLVFQYDYPVILNDAYEAHGLDRAFLLERAVQPHVAVERLLPMISRACALLAHNGRDFDFPLLRAEFARQKVAPWEKPELDTRVDIKYPDKMRSHSLRHLAVDHGLIVDPKKLHSALYDVSLMCDVLSYYDINKVIERSKSPDVKVIADCPREQNNWVKELKFRWDPEARYWWKSVKETDLQELLDKCKFKTRIETK